MKSKSTCNAKARRSVTDEQTNCIHLVEHVYIPLVFAPCPFNFSKLVNKCIRTFGLWEKNRNNETGIVDQELEFCSPVGMGLKPVSLVWAWVTDRNRNPYMWPTLKSEVQDFLKFSFGNSRTR